jgi:trans-aconitate 2-methyltransferase
MLEKSEAFKNKRLSFEQKTVEELYDSSDKWDLIFSNAALQWSDDHKSSFQNYFPY